MDKIKFEEIINKHIPWFENKTAKNWDAEILLRDFAAELLQADSSQLEPQVSNANGGKEKEFITYVLTEPFNDGWYDVAEFDTLEEAKKEYNKKHVAAIMQKTLRAFIMYKKG